MTDHDIASIQTTEHRVTVTCTCGRTFEHPQQAAAEFRHHTHQLIWNARNSLTGGT